MKVFVIGGVAAGTKTAAKLKRVDRSIDVTIITKDADISYAGCGLPYYVGGLIESRDELIVNTPQKYAALTGVTVLTGREAVSLDSEAKSITAKNLENGESEVYHYDACVIATGASSIMPPLPGIGLKGVFKMRTPDDAITLRSYIKENDVKRAVVAGGGFIGLEVAEEMTQCGVEVHLYEMMPRLLPFLESSFSDQVTKTLLDHGVHVHTGVSVDEILACDGRVSGVKSSDGQTTDVDFVLMSIGVVPNGELAAAAGLEMGLKGGIVVDDSQQTSDPCIWACGDCVQMKNRITGEAAYVPLGTTANKQGRIAGTNAAGGHDTFPGVLGSMVTKVFDLYIAATGLSAAQAEKAGYDAAVTTITKGDKASYYPGSRDNQLCLIFDKKDGRLLGAQGIGSESVAGRINVFVAAITCGMTVSEINELDLVYAPPVAPVYDPILIAASQAMKKVGR